MTKFNLLARDGRWDDAYQEADKAADALEDAQMLNQLAWIIVDPDSTLEQKNVDVAMKAALKANKLTEEKDGPILDTVARCHWLKGDKAKAIELQKKAVEVTEDPMMKQQIEETLKEYQAEQNRQQ